MIGKRPRPRVRLPPPRPIAHAPMHPLTSPCPRIRSFGFQVSGIKIKVQKTKILRSHCEASGDPPVRHSSKSDDGSSLSLLRSLRISSTRDDIALPNYFVHRTSYFVLGNPPMLPCTPSRLRVPPSPRLLFRPCSPSPMRPGTLTQGVTKLTPVVTGSDAMCHLGCGFYPYPGLVPFFQVL